MKPPGLDRIEWTSDLIRLEIALWGRIEARLQAGLELSLSFFESLYFIDRAPGGSLRVGDLAAALCVTIGGTSKLVDRIEAAGRLSRVPDPDDRRAARVVLTDQGRRTLAAAVELYEAEVAALIDPVMSPEEQRAFHGQVSRLLTAVREAGR